MTTIAQPHDATCRCPQCTMPSGMGVDLYQPAQLRALGVDVLVPLPHPRTVVAQPRDATDPWSDYDGEANGL